MKIILVALLFVCVAQSWAQKSNKTIDTKELGIDGGGYILPPSRLFDGVQPEANWI